MSFPQTPTLERLYQLSPTANAASRATLAALYGHACAPVWNHPAGDRLQADDVEQLARFDKTLHAQRGARMAKPDDDMLAWATSRIAQTPLYRLRFGEGLTERDLEQRWQELPTTSREDVAMHADRLTPDDVALKRMIIYRTAGTTGHALLVPQDALAVASYTPC